ncbi:MAG: GNAT family N-acetyltransferase [Treponema sp.]|nr:GNAT family N-acetyltransferase [Treponema sp.]
MSELNELIEYKILGKENIEILMESRLEMLRAVNKKPADYKFSDQLVQESRAYFEKGNYKEVIAFDGDRVIGCAGICFLYVMPTFDHPSGKRAHLMNVYTHPDYRKKGIASKMVKLLIEEARNYGASEISLDASDMGRPVYEKLGFKASCEAMTLTL